MNTGYVVRSVCAWVIGPLAIGLVCGALLGTEHESHADECPEDERWLVGERTGDNPTEALRWPASGVLSINKLVLDDESDTVTLEFASE
jgi:hypothetical protein